MRRGGLCTAAMLIAAPAFAGDFADREIIGFSPDGTYFAFEEYGVQDGSGFPYSNIYVIETAADRWVEGTPVRVRREDENAYIGDIRSEARDKALDVLEMHDMGQPGPLLVSNPATETSADPRFVSFRLRPPPASEEAYSLTLADYTLPAAGCPDMGQPFKGYRLTLAGPDGNSRVLAEDTRIPVSRRCPLGYAISDVVAFFPETGTPVLVALVSVLSLGFEGPDRRFLAVTSKLDP